ncbi:N-acetylglucosamine-6-phosphate deacetylase [Salinimonas chungwhensis]|uniref:N-acetylglucosamine-6-phosphate deacetylase n=1 Tax=Salinimonas chungwhensis TaxID=265425 RepID=UPI00047809BC|nr:N-acetylglucosamine-6-phosphate deacetylase [Salinimonas chungwhensis]
MMKQYFADRLFDGHTMLESVLFSVDRGRITSLLQNASLSSFSEAEHFTGLVTPGFVDVQVNGGGGVQFNDKPSVATLLTMAEAHRQFGTTSMMPTIITDDIAVMQKAADAQAQAHAKDPACFVGIHFEGPHLSQAKKGMHSSEYLRSISDQELALFSRKDIGRVMVTVAPETVSVADINKLIALGVIVSLGHTNATFDQASEAFTAGATGATHLYNAMSPLTSREPGVVGSALYHEHVYCGLINDTHHVHPASIALAMRLKGADKTMLITDAMAPAGSDIDYFVYQGETVYQQGKTLNLADGTLAGSNLTMIEAVRNTHHIVGINVPDTLQMATSTPAAFLQHQQIGQLRPGAWANFLVLDEKLSLTSVNTAHP